MPANFKPLSFTTTVRNPERIKFFIKVLEKFEGEKLTNNLAKRILLELIREKVIRPDQGFRKHSNLKEKYFSNEKFLITGVDLIDNLLFWTDDKNPPRKIDVRRNYPTPVAGIDIIVEEDISVVRKPPGFQVLDTITAPLIRLIRIQRQCRFENSIYPL